MSQVTNYFKLFQLPEQFIVQASDLSERYKSLQLALHPDRYASKSEQEQRIAIQKTAELNDAYQVLKNPRTRALHMLALRGIDHPEESTLGNEPAFLMQQMEWREDLESASSQSDPIEFTENLMKGFQQTFDNMMLELGENLAKQTDEGNEQAGVLCKKAQFVEKILREADNLLADLEDEL